MSELRELYQEVIIDHGRHPRNVGVLANANLSKEGFNPLCGDKIKLYVEMHQDVIHNVMFQGCGCAISMASASLMTESIKGKTVAATEKLFDAFHELVTIGTCASLNAEQLGKLTVLGGVSEFPARVKCASLAWHTLRAALAQDPTPITTEDVL